MNNPTVSPSDNSDASEPHRPLQWQPRSLAINRDTILAYAQITNDFNPIHVDPEFAATTSMGGVIAHGTMSLNLIWQSLAASLGSSALVGGDLQVRFLRPVRIGQRVTALGEASPETPGRYVVWVENDSGERVIEGSFKQRE